MDETIDLKAGMASWKVLVLTLAGLSVVLDHFVVRELPGTLRTDARILSRARIQTPQRSIRRFHFRFYGMFERYF